MARRVFFSFHYDRDIRRVVQVRNSWIVRAGNETQTFMDKAEWESIKRTGAQAIEKWIDKQLNGTSVTVVLIGAETYDREWVKHEIKRSYELGKGMLGIFVHSVPFSELYKTYDWVREDGYSNFASWIEGAAVAAGR